MSVNEAVLSYLESYAPAKPSNISATTEKPIKAIYSALYQLKKAGKVKNLKGKGWTVMHRTPKKQVVKDTPAKENTVRQYSEEYVLRRTIEAARVLGDLEDKLRKQEGVIEYLEDKNALLRHELQQLQQDLNRFAGQPLGEE